MKPIYSARHGMDAHLVRGFLVSHGIKAEVRGEFLAGGWGELPTDSCMVMVDEGQFEEANELLVAFLKGSFQRMFSGKAWSCARCGEKLEGQFTACWSCGAPRP
jgi:hypothetical protein